MLNKLNHISTQKIDLQVWNLCYCKEHSVVFILNTSCFSTTVENTCFYNINPEYSSYTFSIICSLQSNSTAVTDTQVRFKRIKVTHCLDYSDGMLQIRRDSQHVWEYIYSWWNSLLDHLFQHKNKKLNKQLFFLELCGSSQ